MLWFYIIHEDVDCDYGHSLKRGRAKLYSRLGIEDEQALYTIQFLGGWTFYLVCSF